MHIPKPVQAPPPFEVRDPKLAKLLQLALDAVTANDLVLALKYFGACADIDPFNKAVLYFGSEAAQRAYFSLRYTESAYDPEKLAQWRHAALTLTAAASEVNPNDPVALHNVGRFLHDDGCEAEAIAYYRQALGLKREQVATWGNLGTCLYTLGQVAEAELCWSKCVAFEPETPSDLLSQGYVWLRRGDYLRGWKALNARWADQTFQAQYGRPDLGGQMWTGQPLKKSDTLMVHGEQGLGDHVQFARYIPVLLSRGIKVIGLETRAPLKRWFEEALRDTPVVVYERDKDTLPGFTHHVPLMSLPGLLGMEELPPPLAPAIQCARGNFPYLVRANDCTDAEWAEAVAHAKVKRVGLIWKGTAGNAIDAQRSIPDDQLRHLADIPGVTWCPLQFDPTGQSDLTARAWLGKDVEPTPSFANVYELGQIMTGLDMVVSVDTLGAHVSGSLGVPTLMLHRFQPEWRWAAPVWAPWYPSMTHLVQPLPNTWTPLLELVATRLAHSTVTSPRPTEQA